MRGLEQQVCKETLATAGAEEAVCRWDIVTLEAKALAADKAEKCPTCFLGSEGSILVAFGVFFGFVLFVFLKIFPYLNPGNKL